jgi:hypothetical protein
MKGYNVVCQVVVNDQKRFINIFVGLLGSVNASRMFRYLIYYFVQFQGLFNVDKGQEGFAPFFVRRQGVPIVMVDDIAQRRRSQPP